MKKELFRDHFKDYVSRMLKCQFDSLDYKRRSVWMARFYAAPARVNSFETLPHGIY